MPFVATSVVSVGLVFVVGLILFRDSVGDALGTAVNVTVLAQIVRALQSRTWPRRNPKNNNDR